MMSSKKKCCIEKAQQPASDNHVHVMNDLINILSLDSLAKIFMLLPIPDRMAMEQVCSKWKEASVLAWHDIKKYKCSISLRRAYDNRMLTQSDVEEILLRCGKYLNELILSKVCNSSIMPIVVEHCKNLTKLEFEVNEHLSDIYNINDFVDAFTQLDKLVFIKIKMIESNFPIKVINNLPEGIHEIHLFFETNLYWHPKPIFFDLKKFKQLHSLTFNGCMLDKIIQDISELTTLVYLDLHDCGLARELSVFNQLINLEHLTIMCRYHGENNGYVRITPQVLSNILNTCKNLKHFKFTRLSCNKEKMLFKNWVNIRNLEYLDFPWLFTNESVINIVENCQNLKYLEINLWEIDLSELSIIKLTELKNLECVKLYNTQNICQDKLIIAITNNCKKLKRLEIPGIVVFPASIFDGLISKLQYLEYLNFACIENLEDSTIIAIANDCKNLNNLNIEFCTNITETALMTLTNLENLQILNVKLNPNVTDNFISKLKKLKSLNCMNCKKITDVGFIQFIKNCPDLENLKIGVNRNITIDTIIAADNITKNRINDIVLNLFINNREILKVSKSVIKSRWLAVCESNNF